LKEHVLDQKLTIGIASPRGIAAGVFLGAHGPGFQKSLELHLQPQAKYPKFNPQIWVIMTSHPII